eukprot:scaffold1516_cov192-Alexandrium_tamarense.AAC.16
MNFAAVAQTSNDEPSSSPLRAPWHSLAFPKRNTSCAQLHPDKASSSSSTANATTSKAASSIIRSTNSSKQLKNATSLSSRKSRSMIGDDNLWNDFRAYLDENRVHTGMGVQGMFQKFAEEKKKEADLISEERQKQQELEGVVVDGDRDYAVSPTGVATANQPQFQPSAATRRMSNNRLTRSFTSLTSEHLNSSHPPTTSNGLQKSSSTGENLWRNQNSRQQRRESYQDVIRGDANFAKNASWEEDMSLLQRFQRRWSSTGSGNAAAATGIASSNHWGGDNSVLDARSQHQRTRQINEKLSKSYIAGEISKEASTTFNRAHSLTSWVQGIGGRGEDESMNQQQAAKTIGDKKKKNTSSLPSVAIAKGKEQIQMAHKRHHSDHELSTAASTVGPASNDEQQLPPDKDYDCIKPTSSTTGGDTMDLLRLLISPESFSPVQRSNIGMGNANGGGKGHPVEGEEKVEIDGVIVPAQMMTTQPLFTYMPRRKSKKRDVGGDSCNSSIRSGKSASQASTSQTSNPSHQHLTNDTFHNSRPRSTQSLRTPSMISTGSFSDMKKRGIETVGVNSAEKEAKNSLQTSQFELMRPDQRPSCVDLSTKSDGSSKSACNGMESGGSRREDSRRRGGERNSSIRSLTNDDDSMNVSERSGVSSRVLAIYRLSNAPTKGCVDTSERSGATATDEVSREKKGGNLFQRYIEGKVKYAAQMSTLNNETTEARNEAYLNSSSHASATLTLKSTLTGETCNEAPSKVGELLVEWGDPIDVDSLDDDEGIEDDYVASGHVRNVSSDTGHNVYVPWSRKDVDGEYDDKKEEHFTQPHHFNPESTESPYNDGSYIIINHNAMRRMSDLTTTMYDQSLHEEGGGGCIIVDQKAMRRISDITTSEEETRTFLMTMHHLMFH